MNSEQNGIPVTFLFIFLEINKKNILVNPFLWTKNSICLSVWYVLEYQSQSYSASLHKSTFKSKERLSVSGII